MLLFLHFKKKEILRMSIETKKIVEALAKVMDPNTGQDLITMNMVRDLSVEENQVSFTLELPSLDSRTLSNEIGQIIQDLKRGKTEDTHDWIYRV